MCKSALHPFLAALPKCEHHVHLEGTLSPNLEFTLAQKNNISLPGNDAAFTSPSSLLERYSHFTSLDDFLHYYFVGMSALITSSDFEELAWEYFKHAAEDGVLHAEVFFDPEAHTSRGVPYQTVVAGFKAACQRAERELGISTELIICVLRHLPVESAMEAYETAVTAGHFADGTLAGLGISSTELNKPPANWKAVFAKAEKQGIRRTAHAAEEGPPQYIADALDILHVQRIDHGRRLVEDPVLMKRVADEGIMLTLCPISNVCLKGMSSMKDMPIRKFLDAGVHFSINSDDPAYFGGYILDNYCAVQETFQLSVDEWNLLAGNAIEGSWCNDERKRELRKALAHLQWRRSLQYVYRSLQIFDREYAPGIQYFKIHRTRHPGQAFNPLINERREFG
ncbi:Adenine deaminase [Hyphodiscus hymeniophilus]|uniref:Adenine deaminase n=1 Tax=Hyphodiscus hymeniophilus TaxID=353542 RepID=A0A9P6VFU7_9HELO|nr:Adenine deaminase [Hyphodiscus hymeniophilus]